MEKQKTERKAVYTGFQNGSRTDALEKMRGMLGLDYRVGLPIISALPDDVEGSQYYHGPFEVFKDDGKWLVSYDVKESKDGCLRPTGEKALVEVTM